MRAEIRLERAAPKLLATLKDLVSEVKSVDQPGTILAAKLEAAEALISEVEPRPGGSHRRS